MKEVGRDFQSALIKRVRPSIRKNIEDRTPEEKRLWQVLNRVVNLNSIFTSLETVINYLKVDNREELIRMLGIDSSTDYFKYHMENYVIRLPSIPDALAWLANDILGWGKSGNCYGTSIKQYYFCPQSLKEK